METPDPELIEEYRQRNIRWTTESLNQLSFYNNLLLTTSVAFLAFAFNPKYISGSRFTITNMEWPTTLYMVSLITITLSILTGLLISIYRLQDFRITRQVNQIRQRMYEHSSRKLDETTPDSLNYLTIVAILFRTPKITIEDCKTFNNLDNNEQEKIKSKFRRMRNTAHYYGLLTWRNTKLQTLYFAISIIAYFISILINNQ